MTFDTLSYARRLKQAGVPEAQAEAMADATRELLVQDFATAADIAALKSDIAVLRSEFAALDQRLTGQMGALDQRLTGQMEALDQRLTGQMEALDQRLTGQMEALSLRLTIRLGGLIAVGIAVLAAIIKL
jgi:hypothetical protein